MDWGSLLILIAPIVLSFVIGLGIKSPIYQKGKKVLKSVSEALEDDKISAAELQKIIDSFKWNTLG